MRAQMIRDMKQLIEYALVSETLASFEECWRSDLTYEENLRNATSLSSTKLATMFDAWMLQKFEYENNDRDEPDEVYEEGPPLC